MESCTMSRAASVSRTAYTACLKARRSTSARKFDSSDEVARSLARDFYVFAADYAPNRPFFPVGSHGFGRYAPRCRCPGL
jgi:hypothetical protein